MSFANLGLSDALVRAVADAGYITPTPIQSQAIPVVLSGADLLGGAQTGTGKTAAFVLPILQRLSTTAPAPTADTGKRGPARKIRTLILTPTRELAAQVEESVRTYGKHSSVSSCVVFGGVSINPQIDRLRRGIDILVATPGRLLDHCGQRTVDLSAVEILVLDEADRMLDMGFLPDIKRILAILPKRRQNLLFSATFPDPIRALADTLLHSPVSIQVTPRNSTVDAVAQTVHPVDAGRKAELLVHLVKEGNWFQVLVFTRTKHGANKLAARLEKSQIPALAIHGNKSQNARTRALADFKNAKLQVLVATDIAARGLDIEQLPHVVNFDVPHVPEDYVHRIGRTGRAGATGEAVSLVSSEEGGRLRDIERLIKRAITRVVVPGFEPGRPGTQPAEEIEAQDRPARTHSAPRSPRPAHARSAGQARSNGARSSAPRSGGPRSGGPRANGSGEPRGSRPAPARNGAPARGEADGNRAHSDVDGNRAREDVDGNRAPAHKGPTARPGAARFERNGSSSGAAGAGRSAERRGNTRSPGEASSLVRSNLPPGWNAGTQARRGR
ncbi:RNA helicase [Burkholderiales bacterium]|nr:RNA helicase [Burkholderiales bacterium]